MSVSATLVQEASAYVREYFNRYLDPRYVFHGLDHTEQTVVAARMLGEGYSLDAKEMMVLELATWFHDIGYVQGADEHEERSCDHARQYLAGKLDTADLEVLLGLIRSTKVPQQPATLMEQIICDADLSHLGMDSYWDRTGKLRQEFILTRQMIMSEQEWMDFELNFMLKHAYHTPVAREMFNRKKAKHIKRLLKQKKRLSPGGGLSQSELDLLERASEQPDMGKYLNAEEVAMKITSFGRGVETMYRTTYRTHTNLSSLADSKANLMLTVNVIVISLFASNLLPKLQENQDLRLLIPTGILMLTCLLSMIFATLSTRPKITEGRVTREDVENRTANLLFFGNFHNMSLDEFQWGVGEMLNDPEYLYSSMSRDLYFLGKVLAKKYEYLSLCYNIFMYGLIISVLSFGVAFLF
jgi:predicted metal-dependent HD superfamily phosphohydrolase